MPEAIARLLRRIPDAWAVVIVLAAVAATSASAALLLTAYTELPDEVGLLRETVADNSASIRDLATRIENTGAINLIDTRVALVEETLCTQEAIEREGRSRDQFCTASRSIKTFYDESRRRNANRNP